MPKNIAMVKKYGPVKLYYCVTDNPEKEECKLLKKYFEDHCELPPENGSLPRKYLEQD
jgi:hypothetical protein